MNLHDRKSKISIIMHAFADENDFVAQNLNAKEISLRLDPVKYHIFMFHKNKPDPRILKRKNIELIKVSENKYFASIQVLFELLKNSSDIFFYVRTFEIDYFYFLLKRFFGDTKYTIHSIENVLPYPTNRKMYHIIAKSNALHSDYVTSVSNYVAETAENEYNIQTDVVYVGIDTSFFSPSDHKMNSNIEVLFVGSLQKRKRPNLVLEAAKQFPEQKFTIVGKGPLEENLRVTIEEENLLNVSIYSHLSSSELLEKYQSADIFLFPSVHEGFPKVTLEAASCGLPVIAFNNYQTETVVDGKTGFIVGSIDEMMEKLRLLIEDNDLRVNFGKNAREYVRRFDWEEIVKRWDEIFSKIIGLKY